MQQAKNKFDLYKLVRTSTPFIKILRIEGNLFKVTAGQRLNQNSYAGLSVIKVSKLLRETNYLVSQTYMPGHILFPPLPSNNCECPPILLT